MIERGIELSFQLGSRSKFKAWLNGDSRSLLSFADAGHLNISIKLLNQPILHGRFYFIGNFVQVMSGFRIQN